MKAKKVISLVSEKEKYGIESMSLLEKRIISFFFGQMAYGNLVPQPGIKLSPPDLEAEP